MWVYKNRIGCLKKYYDKKIDTKKNPGLETQRRFNFLYKYIYQDVSLWLYVLGVSARSIRFLSLETNFMYNKVHANVESFISIKFHKKYSYYYVIWNVQKYELDVYLSPSKIQTGLCNVRPSYIYSNIIYIHNGLNLVKYSTYEYKIYSLFENKLYSCSVITIG